MSSPAIVKAQLRHIGVGWLLLLKGEVRALPRILWDTEEIQKVAYGAYEGGFGLLVATDRRLLFVDRRFFHLTCDEVPYDNISAVEYYTSLMTGTLKITNRGGDLKLRGVRKRRAREFAEYVDEKICETEAMPAGNSVPAPIPPAL